MIFQPAPRGLNRKVGADEETKALNYFLQRGWRLLHRNYQCRGGEIDLIFKDAENRIVFVEVKYRSSSNYGSAQSFVHAQKQGRLIKTALFYIKENRLEGSDFRFDVAAISPQGIEHISNAFSAEGYTL